MLYPSTRCINELICFSVQLDKFMVLISDKFQKIGSGNWETRVNTGKVIIWWNAGILKIRSIGGHWGKRLRPFQKRGTFCGWLSALMIFSTRPSLKRDFCRGGLFGVWPLRQPMQTFFYCDSHESQQRGKTPRENLLVNQKSYFLTLENDHTVIVQY